MVGLPLPRNSQLHILTVFLCKQPKGSRALLPHGGESLSLLEMARQGKVALRVTFTNAGWDSKVVRQLTISKCHSVAILGKGPG